MAKFEEYKKKILGFYRKHRRMPSYSEIMEMTGLRSKHPVYKLVNKLVEGGIVGKDASGRLTPRDIGETIRVLGYVEAGWPSPAEEELSDTISLDTYLIPRNKEATYIAKVTGRSMVDAGILPGDQVIVERGKQPKEGDIVIAQVDGSWTLKYYRTKGGKPVLYPANPDFKPIVPKHELIIDAVVNAVIRKY